MILRFLFALNSWIFSTLLAVAAPGGESYLWIQEGEPLMADRYVAFRGTFEQEQKSKVLLHLSGASAYNVFIDGRFLGDGPVRYKPEYPLYETYELELEAGTHVVAVLVNAHGAETRMLEAIDPFLYCKLYNGGVEVPLEWKYLSLPGYHAQVRRVNPQLSWLEWNDTRQNPENWEDPRFDDSNWQQPVKVNRNLGAFSESMIHPVKSFTIPFAQVGQGPLAEFYGYEKDNPSARFFLRDLVCDQVPPQGLWKRYDLGRVRLARPEFEMDLPAGAIVEFAFSEYLQHNRVMPWINLSAGDSYNMVHFVARGGKQIFRPFDARGGRFVELHVIAPTEKIEILKESFLERNYYDIKPQGLFVSGDSLIDRIWTLGVDTYLACAEDALVDNPTRERGQWMGDAVVGLRIAAAAFSDVKLVKNSLYHHAQSARQDGMVAGLSPGNKGYLSTFAALWTGVCIDYYRSTGDITVLKDLWGYAEKNIAAFEAHKSADGIGDQAGWGFVDWGYVRNSGPSDMGLNLIYYGALNAMVEWSRILNLPDKVQYYTNLEQSMRQIIQGWFQKYLDQEAWEEIGYHRTTLGLKYGFIPESLKSNAIDYMKQHILSCFPNDRTAPRLSDPDANNPRLITPYFANYSFPLLIEAGESDFVMDQYRKTWGWMLDQGATTCLEVFDTRWSHCHGWAGSPTWLLSRYHLGLHPDFTHQQVRFNLNLKTGSLKQAKGVIPYGDGQSVQVEWRLANDMILYTLKTSEALVVQLPDAKKYGLKPSYKVKKSLQLKIPAHWVR